MSKGVFNVPIASNEPVKSYKTGSKEREELLHTYNKMNNSKIDVPLYIGGQKITTDNKKNITPPHDHQHILGQYSLGEKKHPAYSDVVSIAVMEAPLLFELALLAIA